MWLKCDKLAGGSSSPGIHRGQNEWILHLGCSKAEKLWEVAMMSEIYVSKDCFGGYQE